MADEMYRSVIGWHEADEKHKATHMLLSMDEYKTLCHEKNQAINDRDRMEMAAINYKQDADKNARMEIDKTNKDAKQRIDEMAQKLMEEIAEREYQERLNENLLRISRERSNVERKLQPKREHTGYVVMQSQEKEVRYIENRKTVSVTAWETVIQSPYTVDFTEEQARIQIDRDLTPEDGYSILGVIGMTSVWYTDIGDIVKDKESKEKNVVFQKHLRANFKVGYWEVIYVHTKALGLVPKEMRAK